MVKWENLRPYLPAAWMAALEALPPAQEQQIQEIRLRAGQPVTLSTPAGERYLCRDGVTALRQRGLLVCSTQQLEGCFLRFCQESVYAYQEQLRQGFIALPGGVRVGVAGRVVTNGVKVETLQDVTSLCIRLPREHRGCAAGLMPLIAAQGGIISTLLVGPPSSGKTSLLRDTAAGLAALGWRVTVVDERGEIAGMGSLSGCDVLYGCPKAAGIRQAVRCLAPDVILFDELGDQEEIRAVAACAHAGVAVIASLHGRSLQELERKPLVRELAAEQVFSRWVFLAGRKTPGVWTACLSPEVKADEIYWHTAGDFGWDRSGAVLFPALISAG